MKAIINMKDPAADEEIKKEIARNIKRIRKNLRTHQTTDIVAKQLGISRVAFTQMENGKNNVSAVNLWKLACIFGCEIEEFFPKIPEGFELSENDTAAIEKIDERAVEWAKTLFGQIKK